MTHEWMNEKLLLHSCPVCVCMHICLYEWMNELFDRINVWRSWRSNLRGWMCWLRLYSHSPSSESLSACYNRIRSGQSQCPFPSSSAQLLYSTLLSSPLFYSISFRFISRSLLHFFSFSGVICFFFAVLSGAGVWVSFFPPTFSVYVCLCWSCLVGLVLPRWVDCICNAVGSNHDGEWRAAWKGIKETKKKKRKCE